MQCAWPIFEQAFHNDDVLRKEVCCTTELDYTEQTSWLLFLKYLDGLEQDRADEAALSGKKYALMLDKPYRWEYWAAPKDKEGKLDHTGLAQVSGAAAELLRLRDTLFPEGLAHTQKTYRGQAGHGAIVAAQLNADLQARLREGHGLGVRGFKPPAGGHGPGFRGFKPPAGGSWTRFSWFGCGGE